MAADQFSLCWNNFHSNLSSGFHSLYQSEDFVDVTLAAEGRYLKAHKMVLSVCSQYFKELFTVNPCKHPIVILKDVSYCALRDLLQFMYLGEVSVSQEELGNLMKVAELLQIKGLTDETVDTSHINQNGLKNIHVSEAKSMTDTRAFLKRSKPFSKKPKSDIPSKLTKLDPCITDTESRAGTTGSVTPTLTVDSADGGSVTGSVLEPELVVTPKDEPLDVVDTGDGSDGAEYSEYSIPDVDVSAMLDTSLGGEPSATPGALTPHHTQICWKQDSSKIIPPGDGATPGVFMFTRSRKGMPHLIYDSNLFRPSGKVSNSIGSHKYWECVQNRKTGCRARCLSLNGEVKTKCREHNHQPPTDYIRQREASGAVYYMPL